MRFSLVWRHCRQACGIGSFEQTQWIANLFYLPARSTTHETAFLTQVSQSFGATSNFLCLY